MTHLSVLLIQGEAQQVCAASVSWLAHACKNYTIETFLSSNMLDLSRTPNAVKENGKGIKNWKLLGESEYCKPSKKVQTLFVIREVQ